MHLHRLDEATDMQHGQFGSGHDLEPKPNFKDSLSRSNYTSFDASWQREDDVGEIIILYWWFGIWGARTAKVIDILYFIGSYYLKKN